MVLEARLRIRAAPMPKVATLVLSPITATTGEQARPLGGNQHLNHPPLTEAAPVAPAAPVPLLYRRGLQAIIHSQILPALSKGQRI